MKKAVVVGASSGIGREVARLLLQQGWSVGLAARREEPLHALAHDYPDRAWVQAIDVTRDDAPQALMALIGQMGGIDLYSTPLVWDGKTLPSMPPRRWARSSPMGWGSREWWVRPIATLPNVEAAI